MVGMFAVIIEQLTVTIISILLTEFRFEYWNRTSCWIICYQHSVAGGGCSHHYCDFMPEEI